MYTTHTYTPAAKAQLRAELVQLAAEFLALGGRITVCPPAPSHQPTYWGDLPQAKTTPDVIDLRAWILEHLAKSA